MTTSLIANSPRQRLGWLLVISFAVKVLYVFLLTDYQHYLFSDFQGYWDRALERLHGDDTGYNQWAIWPPLPHILLSEVFRVIDVVGLSRWRLEAVLLGNIFLSTLGVALLYGIALRLTASSRTAFIAAALYAFAFPLVYLNAFVMSEHPAVAALLTALWLTIRFSNNRGYLFVAGSVLALATGLRPAFGLIALPLGLYVLLASPFVRLSIARAAIFTLGFSLTIVGAVAEVHRISRGELDGLSANGGLNFYFAQCRTHQVVSQQAQYGYYIVPPATVQLPENGSVIVDRPFHDQAFFAELGWLCVRAQPDLWWRNAYKLRDLFFGPLLPSAGSAWGFNALLPVFRWFAVVMALCLPLGLLGGVSKRRSEAALLGGAIFVSLATQYLFNAEHRYLYPLFGLMLTLDAWIIVTLYRQWQTLRKAALGYVAVIIAIGIGIAAHTQWQRMRTHTLIAATWYETAQPFGLPLPPPAGQFAVDTLRFLEAESLRHVDKDALIGLPFNPQQIAIRFTACMVVDVPGRFEFVVASDDGFELSLDDQVVASHRAVRPYAATRGNLELDVGPHRYLLQYAQETGPAGVTGVWRRSLAGDEWMPAVGLKEIGEDGDGVRFLPPGECAATPKTTNGK